MTTDKAISILRQFNEWRRGNSTEWSHSTTELGQAIDMIIQQHDEAEAAKLKGRGKKKQNPAKYH